MKTLLLMLLCVGAYAQQQSVFYSHHEDYVSDMPFNENGEMIVSEVIPESGNAEELYTQARLFFANNFRTAQNVIQIDDPASKTIIGKGNVPIYIQSLGLPMEQTMFFTIKIQCKDGKYKYDIYDFYYNTGSPYYQETYPEHLFHNDNYYRNKKGKVSKVMESYKMGTQNEIRNLMNLIKSSMTQAVSSNW